jgi:UDP-N-acetyl-D-mannosaminuronate dehydrogenase
VRDATSRSRTRPNASTPVVSSTTFAKTPKVVGGLTKKDADLAARFYGTFIPEVELVSTPCEAEMAKLVENTSGT